MKNTGRNVLLIFVGILLLAGSFSGGVLVGWLIPGRTSSEIPALSSTQQPQAAATQAATSASTETLFAPFWEAWTLVHQQYIDQPVNDTKLMQGAIRGMLDSLGDTHTGYMTPEEFTQANMPLSGSYEGIGAYVDSSGKLLTIVTPMPGSPAEKAGLKAGDEIIAVDGKSVEGVDPSVVLRSVLGPANTTVVLTIHRPNPEGTMDVSIVRQKITLPSVESKMLDSNIAYVAIYTFGDTTSADLKTALTDLLAKNPKGLILDLRNNGGGYLTTAIEVVSQFIDSGVVMYEDQGNGQRQTYNAISGGIATKIPLVVLVNEGTASASEITAGAIQDYGRGKLVGVTTYGKGSVQNWIPLENNQGAVRITIARWLTPKERQINGVGLTPDVVVQMTDADIKAGKDPQLDKAIEILLAQ
ncbi:MAG: S41 family peptidase [Anaerolineaceae bacterium]